MPFRFERGSLVRGIPTSYAAPPMSSEFVPDSDPPPVWPDAEGTVRGFKFTPLSRSAPKPPGWTQALEVLAWIDTLRDGRARERQFAEKELAARLATTGVRRQNPNLAATEAVARRWGRCCRDSSSSRLCYRTPDHRSGQRAGARHARRGRNSQTWLRMGNIQPWANGSVASAFAKTIARERRPAAGRRRSASRRDACHR
jgi:hypothetical protein